MASGYADHRALGEREFIVEGDTPRPGEAIFAPRGVPHAQRRVEPGVGRELVVLTPGGFEQFFRDLAEAERNGTLGPGAYAEASERAGISWL